MSGVRWFLQWPNELRPQYRVGRDDRALLVAEWPGVARLTASEGGEVSEFEPMEGAPETVTSKLRRGPVPALLRHLAGKLSFHASAVARNETAILMFGESGVGKSTNAAALCADGKTELLTDDIALVDEEDGMFFVLPQEGGHSLDSGVRAALGYADFAAGKREVSARTASARKKVVAAVHIVEGAAQGQPSLTPLLGSESFAAISRSMFRFVLDDSRIFERDFSSVAAFCRSLRIYRLSRTASLADLGRCTRLLRHVFDVDLEAKGDGPSSNA